MRIGLDFDNTIVSYAGVFHRVAVETGLLEAGEATEVAGDKTSVRDHLRAAGREEDWIRLQGEVYGARMELARPFPGVAGFFEAARAAGVPLVVVSHKTRHAKRGPRHDLHAAARDFLERHGLAGEGTGLPFERVFFEAERAAKLARIAGEGCTVFVDDLPEVLDDPGFPAGVTPVLFDPDGAHGAAQGRHWARVRSWARLSSLLLLRPGTGAASPPGPSRTAPSSAGCS